ncbi:MAG TPA: SDR family oxidoreductase [Paracoccaceae bacterium]|nr:SDR family oxidoreductase [Paracoccaceae bacterium]
MSHRPEKRVLVAGASGTVGQAAVAQFEALGDWQVLAVSRRPPEHAGTGRVRHIAVDLLDADACRAAVAGLPPVTHLVYTALHERPDLVAGWRDPGQMATNLAMLRNLIDPLAGRGGLRHVSLLQGTKAYGVHLRPIRVPAREHWPRDAHDNFYWLQEDYLRAQAGRYGFAMTVLRPQIVFGDVLGVAMNLIPVLGAWAAIRREEGRPFSFPGGPPYLLEATDARLLARVLAWAAESPAAAGETFNVTNGDVFVWQNVWPAIAAALGVEPGEPEPQSVAEMLAGKAQVWDRIVARHGLRPVRLAALLGQSDQYADFCFARGAKRPPAPALVSTIKLRKAGFHDCIDTEDMFVQLIGGMQARRLIPSPG